MFSFLQLKVRLNELSNIYQTEFDQSPAQACAIDLPELNYGLCSNYLFVIGMIGNLTGHLLKYVKLYGKSINKSET